jgi:iron complex transport system substrate-binding protein
MKKLFRRLTVLAGCMMPLLACAAISVRDDNGAVVTIDKPAQRVVTLAPHITELVFAGGGGDRIVGTVTYSDYPAEARAIARVGDHKQIDIERIVALKPDLLLVWLHGNAERQLDHLRRLGIPVYYSEPHKLADIPDSVQRIARLLGTEAQAEKSAAELRDKLRTLAERYGKRPVVRVFYQLWDRPLYTLNGGHIISDVIRLCGGENIFSSLSLTAPSVTVESVLQANPEAIVTGNRRNQDINGLELWKQYPSMLAVKRGNLFVVGTDLLVRSGPRMIDGAAAVCETLEQARGRR